MDSKDTIKQGFKDKSFFQELFSEAFDLDYGLWQTFVMLFKHPQNVVNAYFKKEETNYFGPFKYAMFTTAIATFVLFIAFDFEAFLSESFKVQNAEAAPMDKELAELTAKYLDNVAMIMETLSNQYGTITTLLFMIPSFALFSFLFFRRKIRKFSSHFILNTYLIGQLNFIQFFLAFPLFFIGSNHDYILAYLSLLDIVGLIYFVYAYIRLFYLNKAGGLIMSLISPMLGYLLCILFLYFVSGVVALIMVYNSQV